MILSGNEIKKQVHKKKIIISPFTDTQLNPNSYNFKLGKKVLVYTNSILDPKIKNPVKVLEIPKNGLVLQSNKLYLGYTLEIMGSNSFVPIIRGRSSTGRIGLFVHITAGLIDIGSINQYTLMMHAVQPVKIYRGMEIGQVTFWTVKGDITLYKGKYQGASGPRASQVYKDFF